jgi:hypothetical protein
MNLKLKRTTRTPYSEEVSIFDMETLDANDEPVSIGKVDLHYVEDQVVGTLLIWQEFATGYRQARGSGSQETLDDLIGAVLAELTEPVGVSATYAVEVYYPPFAGQGFASNYPDDEEGEEGAVEGGSSDFDPDMDTQMEDGFEEGEEPPRDDFADRLRQRP